MNGTSEYKTLQRNTKIIAFSNIGSKAISFILAPMYSYYLSKEQYGTTDLILTLCGLIVPVICLDIFEAVFRYTNDNKYSSETILSSSLSLVGIEMVVVSVGLLLFFRRMPLFVVVSVIYAEIDSFYQVLSQFVRGQNKIKSFAISGILNSIVLLISNIFFIVLLKYELKGWAVSFVLAKIIACLYVCFVADVRKNFSLRYLSRPFLNEAFRYCIPLLPNAIMWWVMNMSDRIIISVCIGVGATGIYAVASKVPSLMSVFENVFFQSWQTSANNSIDKDYRDIFVSTVFKKYIEILTVAILGVLAVLRPIILFFSSEYRDAWIYSGILVLAVMIHALGGILGAIYCAQKKTVYALYTSLAGAVTNIILNLILIPVFGLVGASITTFVGYSVVLLYRYFNLKKSIYLQISISVLKTSIILIILQMIFYYANNTIGFVLMGTNTIVGLIIYRQTLVDIIKR